MSRVYFEVESVLGKRIRTTLEHWRFISEVKHPLIKEFEAEVKKTIKQPDTVRKSKRDPSVFLYYRKFGNNFVCVLAKHLNGEGFVVTAYIADKVKRGETVWEKAK